jgi:hypothetical protein
LATHVKIGLGLRRSYFVGFYVLEGHLYLFADGRSFDLARSDVRVRRTSVGPFVKRFSVCQGENRAIAWTYWFTDFLEDGFIPRDFLSYIAREVAPKSKHQTKVLVWEERAAGRDPWRASFQEELSRVQPQDV